MTRQSFGEEQARERLLIKQKATEVASLTLKKAGGSLAKARLIAGTAHRLLLSFPPQLHGSFRLPPPPLRSKAPLMTQEKGRKKWTQQKSKHSLG